MIQPAATPGSQAPHLPPRPRVLFVPRWVRFLLGVEPAEEPEVSPPAPLPEERDPPLGVTCRCYPR